MTIYYVSSSERCLLMLSAKEYLLGDTVHRWGQRGEEDTGGPYTQGTNCLIVLGQLPYALSVSPLQATQLRTYVSRTLMPFQCLLARSWATPPGAELVLHPQPGLRAPCLLSLGILLTHLPLEVRLGAIFLSNASDCSCSPRPPNN